MAISFVSGPSYYTISSILDTQSLGVDPMPSGGHDGYGTDGGLDGGPDGAVGMWPVPGSSSMFKGVGPKNGNHLYLFSGTGSNPTSGMSYPSDKVLISGIPNASTDSQYGYNGGTYSGRNAQNIQYVGGGSTVRLSDNSLVCIAHCERWAAGNGGTGVDGGLPFYSTLAVIRSTNEGASWTWIGEIISTSLPITGFTNSSVGIDIQHGSIVPNGAYWYIYFGEQTSTDGYTGVARCLMSSFESSILGGTAPTFLKRTTSGWNGQAFNLSSNSGVAAQLPCLPGPSFNYSVLRFAYTDCIYHIDSRQYVMIGFGGATDLPNGAVGFYNAQIFISTSSDGINWSATQALSTLQECRHYNSGLGYNNTSNECAVYSFMVPDRMSSPRMFSGKIHVYYTMNTRFDSSQCTLNHRTVAFNSPDIAGRRVRHRHGTNS